MDIKKYFLNRTVGFYMGLISCVLAAISLISYLMNVADGWNIIVLIPLVLVVVVQVLSIFIDNDLLTMAAPILCAISLCSFMVDSVGSLVDYFFNIRMFGDVSMVGFITQFGILTGIALILLIVASYMNKTK